MSPHRPDLSIIIVSHGHEHFLHDCVHSLIPSLYGLQAEILLVDNLGTGRVPDAVGQTELPVTFLVNRRPLGFAHNMNNAARQSRGRYLLLLNPDTRFLSGHVADALSFMEKDHTAGVVGCRLVNPDGSLQINYRRFPTLPAILARGLYTEKWLRLPRFYQQYLMVNEPLNALTIVDWVLGAFILVSRQHFEMIGGMDERFFLYYEDVDLCYRLRQRGLKTYYFPFIEVLHHHRRTSAAQPLSSHWRRHVHSLCRFFRKHRYLFHPIEENVSHVP
jgi:GT2 family glycosyltransferase